MKNKKLIVIIFALLISIILLIVYSNNRNKLSLSAPTKTTYTREELEDLVVATAVSYYYKHEFTDYEGFYNEDAHSTWSTNYNLTPEMIGSSKKMTTQCEAFATSCYMHTFGFDFVKYRESSKNYDDIYQYIHYLDSTPVASPNYNNNNLRFAALSDTYFKNLYKYFNKGYSVSYMNLIARHIANNKYGSDPTLVLTYQKDKIQYKIDGYSGDTSAPLIKLLSGTVNISTITNKLRPGDILLNDGHAMLWVGSIFESEGGVIHSSGTSYSLTSVDKLSETGGKVNGYTGSEEYDVRYASKQYIFDRQIRLHGKKVNHDVTILRPINSICNTWSRVKTNQDSDDDVCTSLNVSDEYITKALARKDMINLRTEEYVYNPLDLRVLGADSSSINNGDTIQYVFKLQNKSNFKYCTNGKYGEDTCESNGYCTNYLIDEKTECENSTGSWLTGYCSDSDYRTQSECSSNNKTWYTYSNGFCSDIRYSTKSDCINKKGKWKSYSLNNRTNNIDYTNIVVQAPIPENTTFESCTGGCYCYKKNSDNSYTIVECSKDNSNIYWNNINALSSSQDEIELTLTVRVNEGNFSKITNKGFKITHDGNSLTMGEITTFVNSSIDGKYNTIFKEQIDGSINSSCENSIKYFSDKYNELSNDENINFEKSTSLKTLLTAKNIQKGIFKRIDVDATSTPSSFSIPISFASRTSFVKRLDSETAGLTSNEKAVRTMLVDYFYGGRKSEKLYVSGKMEELNKITPIYSIVKNFNYGDIIVFLKRKNDSFNDSNGDYFNIDEAIMYTGSGSYVYCNNSVVTKYTRRDYDSKNTDWYSTKYLMYKMHNSDLFVVLRPSKYYNLKQKYSVEFISAFLSGCPTGYTYDQKNGKCLIDVFKSGNKHTYGDLGLTWPTITRDGYERTGWHIYKDNKVVPITEYDEFVLDKAIYPVWTANTYKVTLNNQNATTTGTKEAYYQYKTNKKIGDITCYYYSDYDLNNCLSNGYTIVKPTKTGYTFGGYYTGTNGTGTQYVNSSGNFTNSIYNTIGNKILYAYWKPNIYEISLDNNKIYEKYGVGFYSDKSATSLITKISIPTRTGYTFKGYYTGTNGTGTKIIDNDGSIKVENTKFTSNTTINAYWTANEYEIVVNKNGGTGGPSSVIQKYDTGWYLNGTKITYIAVPIKENYTFLGYYSEQNGKGVRIVNKDGKFVNNTPNIYSSSGTMYAFYQDNSIEDYRIINYSVSNDENIISGIVDNTSVVNYKKNFILPNLYTMSVEENENLVYTGSITKIFYNQVLIDEFTNIVLGDLTGNGKSTLADVMKAATHVIKGNVLTEQKFLKAADINNDNNVTLSDVMRMANHVVKGTSYK